MAHKDGEASVEDILRSIKQVISREDGPRGAAPRREDGTPGSERPTGFSPTPYSFTRHSPFGSRSPEVTSSFAGDESADEAETEGRTDVFDLKSLDSDALELDEDEAEESTVQTPPLESSTPKADEVRMIVPPSFPPIADEEVEEDEPAAPPSPYGFSIGSSVGEEAEAAPEEEPIALASEDIVEDADDTPITLEPPYEALPTPEPEPAASTLPEPEAEDEPEAEAINEAEPVAEAPEDEREDEPAEAEAADESDTLIASAAADTLRDSFAALQSVASTPTPSKPTGAANPLEDMVREMMRPMLKQWLDDNMPGLVEKIVEREIARITGRL